MIDSIRNFLKLETASGIILVMAAVLAMVIANTPLAPLYDALIDLPVQISVGDFAIAKPLLLWINDGLMAIFFFLIGLELKREVFEGQLSDPKEVVFPALGAIGGMLIPALIYVGINYDDQVALQGWAIPAATDIAFALAILALLGKRVPLTLKILLVSVAIFDDVGAILIIALFYTNELSFTALVTAAACLPILWVINRKGVMATSPYIMIGIVMWVAVLKSGVHATLAGVILAMFIPLRDREHGHSPLHELEHNLHTTVAFIILPVFAFANAGISLAGASLDYLLHPVPFGIIAGLFVGKQVGVFLFCWLGVMLGLARLPPNLRWAHIYGTALLCGVGFTMSLFIASLAFEETGVNLLFDERLGIICGSLLSGVVGYLVLHLTLPAAADK
ncbi:MAG: Na+/H+ antiporter NhaA [Gammaproteobacteria bacterium]|nr:Na+/H+ antiporter NhaA [Gammaproteobacteria bacterium]